MYGLEKKEEDPFLFDLEEEIVKNPTQGKQYLEIAKKRESELKEKMRKGDQTDDFDQMGILLQGYKALNKVLSKVLKQQS